MLRVCVCVQVVNLGNERTIKIAKAMCQHKSCGCCRKLCRQMIMSFGFQVSFQQVTSQEEPNRRVWLCLGGPHNGGVPLLPFNATEKGCPQHAPPKDRHGNKPVFRLKVRQQGMTPIELPSRLAAHGRKPAGAAYIERKVRQLVLSNPTLRMQKSTSVGVS